MPSATRRSSHTVLGQAPQSSAELVVFRHLLLPQHLLVLQAALLWRRGVFCFITLNQWLFFLS